MLAIGGLLTCIALLTLAVIAPVFRSKNPPRWTTYGWAGEVVTLAIVSLLALGVGFLAAGVIDAAKRGIDYAELGLLAGMVVATVVIWRGLRVRARSRALEADAAVPAPMSGSADAPGGAGVATAEPAQVSASQAPPPHRAA